MKTIRDRYSIQNKLGQGGSSITYAAIDKETNKRIAIKALSLTGLDDWKKIELFEREAKILQQLNHPAIPSYLDYFQIDTKDDIYFYIVQQLAPGQSLAHLINEGWQPDEDTVKNIAIQILEIVFYLQQRTPPVLHRDIKPQNVIFQPDTGKLFLVDFGAVQDAYHHTKIGSTVVGTYGYMAPEQYHGGAVLATDLYSLGCTLLFLLTGESPAELPQKKLKIDFRNSVNINRDFANWIDKLIEPNVKDRFPNAEAALLVLQDKASLQAYQNDVITKPSYSSIKISQDKKQLIIELPPPCKRKRLDRLYYILLLWSIVSLLNRLAIFLSVNLFGKLLLIFDFSKIYFLPRNSIRTIFLSLLLLAFLFLLNLISYSVPTFSLIILTIDLLLELLLKHHLLRQLLSATKLRVRKDCSIIIENQFDDLYDTENINYRSFALKYFISDRERKWIQSEIEQFLK